MTVVAVASMAGSRQREQEREEQDEDFHIEVDFFDVPSMSDGVGLEPRFSILTQQTPAPRWKGGSSAKTEHRRTGQVSQLPSQGSHSAESLCHIPLPRW